MWQSPLHSHALDLGPKLLSHPRGTSPGHSGVGRHQPVTMLPPAPPAVAPWRRCCPDPCLCVSDEARSKKCGVLVHCLAGISRSVTVTVAYLMQKMNLSLNDAYDFVKRKKSNISPNFNFMGQLLDFERTLGLSSPCDNHTPSEQLYFSTPTNHNLFPLNTLEST